MIGAKVERQRKVAQDRPDALGNLGRDMGEQKLMLCRLAGEARAAAAQQAAVEKLLILTHRACAPPFIGPVRALSCLPWRSTGRRSRQEFLPSGLGSFRRRRLFAARSTSAPISSSRRSASPAASAPAPTGCSAATAGPESIS